MMDEERQPTRQERRAARKAAERNRMPKHSRRLAELYRRAIEKRQLELDEKPRRDP
ncbi:MAG: hypothetical protein KatS3mg060_0634 [Dehalococcoidia bacterium]|nr:MAG: hypothetical protein KatS3mg060_0634 [Dehalococcoidia bacterium]